MGGDSLGRIKKQKLNSFHAALKNDYNSRMIKTDLHEAIPALINNNTSGLKPDYDKKYISVDFDSGLEAGDCFTILDDGTVWMIYLPILTETAYLRSEIIRCRYELEVNGKKYPVYVQSATETDLRWRLKNNINFNELNISGTIYIKNDENTKNFFHRFTRFKMAGHIWEVQITDYITVPGILELEIQEYYDNDIAELPEIKQEHSSGPEAAIIGDSVAKPDTVVGYMANSLIYDPSLSWSIKDNPRVEIEGIYDNGRYCKVYINAGTAHPFTICYGDHEQKVKVDWHKPQIEGPTEVYPYDSHTYTLRDKDLTAKFEVDDPDAANIIYQDGKSCKVEIVASRSCDFTLSAIPADEELAVITLSIEVKSL